MIAKLKLCHEKKEKMVRQFKKVNYRKDTQNSTTLSHSTQHLCSDTFKSNLRHFHSRHQIFGISVHLKIFIFELVMKIVHYNENDVIVNIILNKQQK